MINSGGFLGAKNRWQCFTLSQLVYFRKKGNFFKARNKYKYLLSHLLFFLIIAKVLI